MQTSKKIFLVGGTGRTGLLVAQGALADGHSVTAIVRREPKIPGTLAVTAQISGGGSSAEIYSGEKKDAPSDGQQAAHEDVVGPHEKLTVIVADFTVEALTPIMAGHDLVIAIVGAWPKPEDKIMTTYSDPARAYIGAMKANGVSRYFTCFGAGFLGEQDKIPKEWQDSDNLEMNVINKVRRDMRVVWDLVLEADLDFSIWCPANFPSGPRSADYITGANQFVGGEVTTGMVADCMIKEIQENKFSKTRVGIARKN